MGIARGQALLVLIAGAALAAPALVLEVRSPERQVVLPMRDAGFTYSYRQSIYDVPVREHLRVEADGIRIERASSTDLRALEYFRWPGSAYESGGALAWTAPENSSPRLEIAVVERGEQVVDTGIRSLALDDVFERTSVTVTAARRPLALWLWSTLPWP